MLLSFASMTKPNIKTILAAKTPDEAREYAIEWQKWAAEQSLSYRDIIEWQDVFLTLAWKFDLEAEFKENGII